MVSGVAGQQSKTGKNINLIFKLFRAGTKTVRNKY